MPPPGSARARLRTRAGWIGLVQLALVGTGLGSLLAVFVLPTTWPASAFFVAWWWVILVACVAAAVGIGRGLSFWLLRCPACRARQGQAESLWPTGGHVYCDHCGCSLSTPLPRTDARRS